MTQRRNGPRPATVGTCSFSGARWRPPGSPDTPSSDRLLADGLAKVDEMARQAGEQGWSLDIAALPEHFAQLANGSGVIPEAIDERIIPALAEKACEHRIYIAAPLRLSEGNRVYNSVVMLDRRGHTVGLYHKVFPVLMNDGSLEWGVTPGEDFPVFDLDFGRVGVQICFDVFFDEGWEALGRQEAELVLFPTAAPGVSALRSHAYRHGYYVVASSYHPPVIAVDPTGRDIGCVTGDDDVMVFRADLDYRILPSSILQIWWPELAERYRDRIDLGWHPDEGLCLVTSLDPSLPVGRFLEIEGLETQSERLARSRPAQTAGRGSPPTMPPVRQDG